MPKKGGWIRRSNRTRKARKGGTKKAFQKTLTINNSRNHKQTIRSGKGQGIQPRNARHRTAMRAKRIKNMPGIGGPGNIITVEEVPVWSTSN